MCVPCLWELHYCVSLAMRRVECVKCVEGVWCSCWLYCPWLCRCRCIIRMKTIHTTYLWLLVVGCKKQSSRLLVYSNLLIYSMQQSPFWEANRFLASQEIFRILWNPKVQFSHSQMPATSLYPEPTRSSPYPHIPLPEDPSLSIRFTHQNTVYASPLPHTRYMPRPSHSSRFYHPNNIGWVVQIVIYFFPTLLSPRPYYAQIFSSTPYSLTPSACVPPSMWANKFQSS